MEMMDKIQNGNIMAFEENRLLSFKKWPFSNSCKCSIKNMAEAGFYLIANNESEEDAVECFYCNKQLDGWEDSDDPWLEHYKHAPSCDFAKLKKTESQLTVEEFINFYHNAFRNRINKITKDKTTEIENHHRDFPKKFKKDFRKIKN